METNVNRIAVTTTVPRQSQQQAFGEVMKNTLQNAGNLVGTALVGVIPNVPVLSAAVSSVTAFASQGGAAARSASGVAGIGSVAPGSASGTALEAPATTGNLNDMMRSMRQEADRSVLVQMQMQQESREYNTLTNVLKVRHDSAKSAINNIR